MKKPFESAFFLAFTLLQRCAGRTDIRFIQTIGKDETKSVRISHEIKKTINFRNKDNHQTSFPAPANFASFLCDRNDGYFIEGIMI